MLLVRLVFTILIASIVTGASPARADWMRAESPNFIAYGEEGESAIRQRLVRLEEFDRLLRLLSGVAPSSEDAATKLQIYFVDGTGGLRQVRDVGHSVAGFYAATPEGVGAFVNAQGYSGVSHDTILFHEYAHHFMLQHFPAAYPGWYVEGFAEYVSTARFEDDRIEIGAWEPVRASWLGDRSGWLPFERMMFSDPGELRGPENAKYYAQSWLLVHYLLRNPERARMLDTYLVGIGRGADRRASFEPSFGVTPARMQQQVIDYSRSRQITYTRMPRVTAAQPPEVTVSRLPRSADDIVLLDAAMRVGVTRSGTAYLQRMRSAARGHDDPFARRALARAEAFYGDGEAADRLLDPLLEAAPNDAELLYLKGMRHLGEARRDTPNAARHMSQAQRWFVRAHSADENHFPTLFRYAQSLSLEPGFISENTSNILMLAHQLAPQAEGVALAAANLLMRRGEFAQAEVLLARLAVNPHRGPIARLAVEMQAKAQARDAQGLPGVFDLPDEVDGGRAR